MKNTTIKKNNLVIDHHTQYSYRFDNKKDAEKLHRTLNQLYKVTKQYKELDKQFDKIQKQLIQTNLSLNILRDDLEKLNKEIKKCY